MKRILISLTVIAAVVAISYGLTNAFFSDTETSRANTFTAGAIDLKVDNTSYYNGVYNSDTSWDAADLDTNAFKFFNFTDLKPSDWGEDTISLHVDTNDAWGCYQVTLTSNDDNTCTEPELRDDNNCSETDKGTGELADTVEFVFWQDDGDNVFESGETPITQGTINQTFPQLHGALADSQGGVLGLAGQPMSPDSTYYLAKAWCFGTLELNPVPFNQGEDPTVDSGILCNGANLNNATQTDVVTADISFSAIQARNNAGYICDNTCFETVYTASVTEYSQGTLNNGQPITNTDRTDPTQANGAPDWVPGTGTNFYSLGKGGWVILAFSSPVKNGSGADLSIHEATNGRDTYPVESAQVEVSLDGSNWFYVGDATSQPGGNGVTYLDVNSSGLSSFQYVRLTDNTNFALQDPTADGFDLDAVDGVYGACVSPTE